MSAIINILINIVLIKWIGLYAASLSTLIAYLVMFIYRYFDSKKYVKLHTQKGLIISMLILYIVSTLAYYSNNFISQAVIAIIVAIYALVINKKSFGFIMKIVKQKILTK